MFNNTMLPFLFSSRQKSLLYDYFSCLNRLSTVKDDISRYNPVSVRKCYYEDELESQLFKVNLHMFDCKTSQLISCYFCRKYTYKGCQFECALKSATIKAGCVPWDFIDLEGGMPVCTRNQTKLFHDTLNLNSLTKCDSTCLPNCHSMAIIRIY